MHKNYIERKGIQRRPWRYSGWYDHRISVVQSRGKREQLAKIESCDWFPAPSHMIIDQWCKGRCEPVKGLRNCLIIADSIWNTLVNPRNRAFAFPPSSPSTCRPFLSPPFPPFFYFFRFFFLNPLYQSDSSDSSVFSIKCLRTCVTCLVYCTFLILGIACNG